MGLPKTWTASLMHKWIVRFPPHPVIFLPSVTERVYLLLALAKCNVNLPAEVVHMICGLLVSRNYKCSDCGIVAKVETFKIWHNWATCEKCKK